MKTTKIYPLDEINNINLCMIQGNNNYFLILGCTQSNNNACRLHIKYKQFCKDQYAEYTH